MRTQPCLFCGGNADEPDHLLRCDGRQGHVEAVEPLVTMEAFARHTDPETSHAAARSVTEETAGVLHAAILRILRAGIPLSDERLRDELARAGILATPSGARTRRAELLHAGLVVDSGERGTTAAGRKTILWTVPAVRAHRQAQQRAS